MEKEPKTLQHCLIEGGVFGKKFIGNFSTDKKIKQGHSYSLELTYSVNGIYTNRFLETTQIFLDLSFINFPLEYEVPSTSLLIYHLSDIEKDADKS